MFSTVLLRVVQRHEEDGVSQDFIFQSGLFFYGFVFVVLSCAANNVSMHLDPSDSVLSDEGRPS